MTVFDITRIPLLRTIVSSTLKCTAFVTIVLMGSEAFSQIDFGKDVQPILADKCFTCHGPDDGQRVGDFRLDREEDAFSSKNGRHTIVRGDSKNSDLYRRITSQDPDVQMPPPESNLKLAPDQIATLKRWIDEGAKWQRHWSLVKPVNHRVPRHPDDDWCQSRLDFFVLDRLIEQGLQPSPVAEPHTLLRRATLALTGLPPSVEEVNEFLTDDDPRAWEKVVDRLLASPRYGERMAVDWLDAARYADTSGYQNDGPRDMWRWRDYVIESFNEDKPFDLFTVEQLAGDLLPRVGLSQKIATGFNRNHRGNAEGGIIPEEYQVEYVVDRVDTTATVWLGLTIGCARCHDHKYDPISQRDYYRLFAYFNNIPESGRAVKEGNSPPYIKAPTMGQQEQLAKLKGHLEELTQRYEELEEASKEEFQKWTSSITASSPSSRWTLTDGLLKRFSFDDGEGRNTDGTAASDAAEVERFSEGVIGEAVEFVGRSSMELGNVGHFGYFDKFTISAWIRPAEATGTIVSRMVPSNEASGYYIHLENGRVQVNLIKRWLDDSIRVESRESLAVDKWHHVAVTYDGSRQAAGVKMYVNGVATPLVTHADGLNQTFATDEPLRIGGSHSQFSGSIDELRVYDRVLTPVEARILATPQRLDSLAKIAPAERSQGQVDKLFRAFLSESTPVGSAHGDMIAAQRALADFDESLPTVMVMQELENRRPTHVLNRGQYDSPGDEVQPGIPEVFGQAPERFSNNRLRLADWIVSKDNPLTARVFVNRIWQMHFGTGLVPTTEDFGAQGAAPSHPELLDVMAVAFMRSGWRVKELHKMILMSATYQQSSEITPELKEVDPDNQLLARGPRFRLPAETIRDQALFIAGLLHEEIGGPSVRPYQPKGLWKEIASTTEYNQSQGTDLYRRSLYSYWKRTVAPPGMMTLDATSREACVVKRSRTNTPLQALTLMNDITFVEAARCMADRVLFYSDDDTDRIRYAFQLATARLPKAREEEILSKSLRRNRKRYKNNALAASELIAVGESSTGRERQAEELAAWTVVMSTILNLDEVLTLE